jgi:hypothetical protein
MRDYAEIFATYNSALQFNNMWLAGSGHEINFKDHDKYDWLVFKRPNGDAINLTGGELQTIRFIAREVMPQQDKQGRPLTSGGAYTQRAEVAGKYAMGKLSPFGGTVFDIGTGSSFGEGGKQRPLPVPWAPLPSTGTEPYTIPEYLAERQAPIPVSGAVQSALGDIKSGVPKGKALLQGIVPFLVEGMLGGRYYKGE